MAVEMLRGPDHIAMLIVIDFFSEFAGVFEGSTTRFNALCVAGLTFYRVVEFYG